jgi:methyltransferase
MMGGGGAWLVGFVVAQRLAEVVMAERNTRRLLAAGAVEFGRGHYQFIVALHAAWIGALWILGRDRAVDPWLLALFVLLQAGRLWVLVTLGRRWTTRIIVVPGETLVRRGPYRFIRHPNYLIVALEIAVVPLALGLPGLAALFSGLNAVVLALRIRAENAALAWAASPQAEPPAGPHPPTRQGLPSRD